MNTQEKYLLAVDILFAVLSIRFVFPQCKWPLWARLLWVAFVWGVNIVALCYDDNDRWLSSHTAIYRGLCGSIALVAFLGWTANNKKGRLLNEWSDQFEKKI